MTHGSLFSGIGGFDLAAQWAGFENIFQVEIDLFCNKVLAKNFPGVRRYGDIRKFDGTEYRGTIDIISGGFPCQPYSVAGKQKGAEDDRNLWPEMFKVIKEIRPTWVVGENVANIINFVEFDNILFDLEGEGYEVQPVIIPALAVDAKHRRNRVWIVAYNDKFDNDNSGLRTTEISQFKASSVFSYVEDSGHGIGREQDKSGNGFDSEREPTKKTGAITGSSAGSEILADTESRENNGRERGDMAEETIKGQSVHATADAGCEDVPNANGERQQEQRTNEPKQFSSEWRSRWEPEPGVGRTFDGFSSFLDGFNLTFESHKCILAYVINLNGDYNAEEAIARAKKELSTMWCKIDSEVLRSEIGGHGCVQKKKILLAYLCKLKNSFDETWVQLEGKEALKGLLRSLSFENKSSGTPLGSGHNEQRSIKHPNTLQEVSRLLAQHSEEAWIKYCRENAKFISTWDGDWEKGVMRVATGVPHRVDRLKALGNAIVPQVAFRIFAAIKSVENKL